MHFFPWKIIIKEILMEQEKIFEDDGFTSIVLTLHPFTVQHEKAKIGHFEERTIKKTHFLYSPFLSEQLFQDSLEFLEVRITLR